MPPTGSTKGITKREAIQERQESTDTICTQKIHDQKYNAHNDGKRDQRYKAHNDGQVET